MVPSLEPWHREDPGSGGPSSCDSWGAERTQRILGAGLCSWGVPDGRGMAQSHQAGHLGASDACFGRGGSGNWELAEQG